MAQKEEKLTGQEKVEHYLNIWGSDKRSFVSILRQLIFILGIVATATVGIWVIIHAISFYFSDDTFQNITHRLSKISIVFIAFIIVLDAMYLISELISFNRKRKNRLPSIVFGGSILIINMIFFILTCVELFGVQDISRSYLYCIYLAICFSCCLFSTIYCFDAKQKNVKFNPNFKLLKTLSYTIGFLGIFAVVVFVLWIMWYASGNANLDWTCFILGRTVVTLIGDIIVKLICQIILFIVMKSTSKRKTSRIIYLSSLFAIMLGLEFGLGYCFLLDGPWATQDSLCRALMCVTMIFVIATSAVDIAIASRYATHLEREDK